LSERVPPPVSCTQISGPSGSSCWNAARHVLMPTATLGARFTTTGCRGLGIEAAFLDRQVRWAAVTRMSLRSEAEPPAVARRKDHPAAQAGRDGTYPGMAG
jgi:hypothetical protein